MSGAGEDEVAALREQIADLEAVIEEQADRIDDLEKRKADAEAKDGAGDERGDPIEIRTDDENPTLKDIWIAGLPFGKIIDKVEAKINGFDKIEERINDLEGKAGAAGNDRSGSQEDGRSPTGPVDRPVRREGQRGPEREPRARTSSCSTSEGTRNEHTRRTRRAKLGHRHAAQEVGRERSLRNRVEGNGLRYRSRKERCALENAQRKADSRLRSRASKRLWKR